MCGGRAQRRCYVEGYLLRGEEDAQSEQEGSNYTNTTANDISERSPPPAQPFTLLARSVTNRWKKRERPAGNTGAGSQPVNNTGAGSQSPPHVVRLVDHFLDGMLFGMDGLLAGTKEPRCYTAWASSTTTTATCVLRIPRASVFQAMSSRVADITRAVMQEAAWRLRHQYRYGAAFPIPIDILRRSSAVFQCWHVHALQELMAKAFIQVFRDGDVVCEQGVIAPVGASQLLVVLRGSLEVVDFGSLDPPNTLGPLGVLGEEELVLCGYPNRFTVKARQTTDVLTILQEHYLDVSSHNGECGEYARTAIANGIASRMIKSTNCPDALLLDPLANFLFPDALMRRAWAELAEPVFFLQGSGVMRTWDEAAYVYLFQTGTLFQQFGADGPQVPVVNLGDLLSGAVRDDDVQNIQTDMEEEDDIYNAINSPGAYFKPRRGGQPQGGVTAASPAPGAMPAAGPHVWVSLERNLIPGDTSSGGVLTGLMEFALGRPLSLSHLRATSHVVAWRWSRKKLEAMVQEFYPQVWTAIQLQETRDVVRKHFLGMSLKNLKDEAAPRSAEQRRGTTITEDGNDKGVARIG
ncbi:Hypothetical protein, putative [Bodo saltans]|uniref:Cyclic nucleotide-binding domain-containing protein n=1 Tax=Bodo saltans TaxID=75058 RepID=A0A0S4JIV3_BODSA|nr:Hypothetical protein, putative [Bodo saltans]|eukprot:CUG91389.1 Hypothetical protein, putative [Bodo saltans]